MIETLVSIATTPVLDTNAYAPADLMGGINTISSVFTVGGASLQSVTVIDRAHQSGAFDIVLYKKSTAGASTLTDNSAFDLNDTDVVNVAGHVVIASTDYMTAGASNAFATKTGIGLIITPDAAEKNLYCLLVSRDSKTYAAGSLTLWFGFLRD